VQYKNSGAIQIATSMNEIDGITMGLNEDSPTFHSMPKKVRPLHESIVKVSQRVSGFVKLSNTCVLKVAETRNPQSRNPQSL